MRGRTLSLAGLALVAALPALACGGDDDGGGALGGGGDGLATVSGALEVMPDNGEDQSVVWGDFARAAEIAGLERPTDPADQEAAFDYIQAVTGTVREDGDTSTPVAVVPPEAVHVERAADLPGFVDDLGWSMLQVDRFVERQTPPDQITVLEGDFDGDALTEAIGDPADDVWVAGSGVAGEIDPEEITPARPLGESLWLSGQGGDGMLSITRSDESRATTDAALRGGTDGAVLGDDTSLAALAGALDEQSAYSAMLMRPGINGVAAIGPQASAEQYEQICDELLPQPTVALATGITSDDDGPVLLFALAHLSSDAASANADALETIIAEGNSVQTREPWSERFELDGVETTGDGDLVVVARVRPTDPIGTRLWYDVVVHRDNLVTSC